MIDLFPDKAPQGCYDLLKLCKIGYYTGQIIHTVLPGALVQTGSPTGSGRGGYTIRDILEAAGYSSVFASEDKHRSTSVFSRAGLVAMACTANDGHASQFFITTTDSPLGHLKGKHTIIGTVEEGMEVLTKIGHALCDENDRPLEDIIICETMVLEDPFPDPPGLDELTKSPVIKNIKSQIRASHRVLPPNIDPETWALITPSGTKQSVTDQSERRRLEAKSRALTLEMLGDLPSADIAPPENVLFVCKLNPVTQDKDLELLFSRFGQIRSCEIIRDKKTGNSLQYAFIEFEQKAACERAYEKMDQVLIDDKRVRVDFSQSVSRQFQSWRKKQ